jgi:hypothetical protein
MTLFGVESKSFVPPEFANDPEHAAGINQGLKDIEAKIAARVKNEILDDLRSKGIIK